MTVLKLLARFCSSRVLSTLTRGEGEAGLCGFGLKKAACEVICQMFFNCIHVKT